MIKVHTTKKLFGKLSVDEAGFLPEPSQLSIVNDDSDFLGEWTAHLLIIERRQCVLLVHHDTRFPVFIPSVRKPDLKRLETLFEDVFLNTLMKLGLSQEAFERAGNAFSRVTIDTKTNRSVLSSITQYKRNLEVICQHYNLDATTGYSISRELARSFMRVSSKSSFACPATEMALLLGESEEQAHAVGIAHRIAEMDRIMAANDHYLKLAAYLRDHATDNGVTNIPELHGFLTGVLLCSDTILPSTWVPALWGGERYSPEWDSYEDAMDFQQHLMTMYNEIATEVVEIDSFEPLFAKYFERGDRDYSSPWCYGFLKGFALDQQRNDLPEDAQLALAILSIPFDSKFAADFDADGDIIDEHCEQVFVALTTLHYYTRGAGRQVPVPIGGLSAGKLVPFTRTEKVGRNDSCPCGSGKKFKKCCLH